MKPLFSVIIPTYNRRAMVQRAVSSVLRQSITDLEVIVVDDGSVGACIRNLWSDQRVNVLSTGKNSGAAAARNLGISFARGEYISFLDDDDEYDESFLFKTYVRLHSTSPQIGVCWTGVSYCVQEGPVRKIVQVRKFKEDYNRRNELFEAFMSIGAGFGVTYKRKCLEHIGPFDGMLKVTEDTEIFLRTLSHGYLPISIVQPLVYIHNHDGNRQTSIRFHYKRIEECQYLLTLYRHYLLHHPSLAKQLKLCIRSLEDELLDVNQIEHFA